MIHLPPGPLLLGPPQKETQPATTEADVVRLRHQNSNLLAIFHRDGGHYEGARGTEEACRDAAVMVADLRAERDAAVERSGVSEASAVVLADAGKVLARALRSIERRLREDAAPLMALAQAAGTTEAREAWRAVYSACIHAQVFGAEPEPGHAAAPAGAPPQTLWAWAQHEDSEEWEGPYDTREAAVARGHLSAKCDHADDRQEGHVYGHIGRVDHCPEALGVISRAEWVDRDQIVRDAAWSVAEDILDRLNDEAQIFALTAAGHEDALGALLVAWAAQYITGSAWQVTGDAEPVTPPERGE